MKRLVKKTDCSQKPTGFALLVTVIVLVVLASLTAGLATQLTMAKRRQQYIIEYQRARYGLDSGVKYIISEMPLIRFTYESRDDKPDFSDLFWMDQEEYNQSVAVWAETATDEQIEAVMKPDAAMVQQQLDTASMFGKLASLFGGGDSDPNAMEFDEDEDVYVVEIDPNDIQVPGPYGPLWPYAVEPIEMAIGSCDVTITIEDENAKMPLSWLVTKYEKNDKRAQYALERFGEWMLMGTDEVEELQMQCEDIFEKKEFKLNAGPIITNETTKTSSRTSTRRSRSRSRRSRRTSKTPAAPATKTITKKRPAIAHTTDFAKLFHSSLLNSEVLALPVIETEDRVENALKYLGIWGSQHVNVNTAPRHVLEAALTFAVDSPEELAQSIIEQRQEKPFSNIDEIKELGGLNTESFNNLKNYITVTSTFYKVMITSRSGNARARAVLTIVKEGKKAETLMVLYE